MTQHATAGYVLWSAMWLACGAIAPPAAGQGVASPAPGTGSDCGALLTPKDVARIRADAEAGLYDGEHQAGFDFCSIPVTTHVVRESDGSGGLSESRLSTALVDQDYGLFEPEQPFEGLELSRKPAGVVHSSMHSTPSAKPTTWRSTEPTSRSWPARTTRP